MLFCNSVPSHWAKPAISNAVWGCPVSLWISAIVLGFGRRVRGPKNAFRPVVRSAAHIVFHQTRLSLARYSIIASEPRFAAPLRRQTHRVGGVHQPNSDEIYRFNNAGSPSVKV
jgi:hypothetical protein